MKRTILLALTAVLILSSMTACGSKSYIDDTVSAESRVLYSDDNESSEEESEAEEVETVSSEEESSDSEEDTDTAESSEKSSDSSEKKKVVTTTSSKAASSASSKKEVKTTSSKTAETSSVASVNAPTQTTTTIVNGGDNTAAQTTTNSTAENTVSSEVESQNEETTDTEADVSTGSFDESDFVITLSKGNINFNDDIEDVKKILGEEITKQEAPSCKYEGQLDKTFIFSECSINTYPNADGSKDYVVGVVITDPSYTTAKGAKIGTTSEELISIYGNSEDDTASMRKYVIGDKILQFFVVGDTVEEINYIWNN